MSFRRCCVSQARPTAGWPFCQSDSQNKRYYREISSLLVSLAHDDQAMIIVLWEVPTQLRFLVSSPSKDSSHCALTLTLDEHAPTCLA